MLLIERDIYKLQSLEADRTKLPEAVLCRVTYPICNTGQPNANNRIYEKAVWEKVLKDETLREKMQNRTLFGQAEHPEGTQSDLQLTSHVIFEMWIDEKDNAVYQKMDVLDTPTGRIVDALLRANCQVGVSTRAEGDLEDIETKEGKKLQSVVADAYKYIATDFTADPSTFGVMPIDVKRNVVAEIKKEINCKEAKKQEKAFASHLLESMKCKNETCQGCGCCEKAAQAKESEVKIDKKDKVNEAQTTVVLNPAMKTASVVGDVNTVNLNPVKPDETISVSIVTPEPVEVPKEVEDELPPEEEKPEVPPAEEMAFKPLSTEDEVPESQVKEKVNASEIEGILNTAAQKLFHKKLTDLSSEEKRKLEDYIRSLLRPVAKEESQEELEEAKGIAKLYQDAGLPAPKGKGIHTQAFHELAVEIAKGYVKGSKNKSPMSPKKALELAYPTAMKQLGKEKAVKKAHQTKESAEDSISSTAKEMVDLKVQEASIRAERDTLLESSQDLHLQSRMLQKRIQKIQETAQEETIGLRDLLEKKAKVAKDSQQTLNEAKQAETSLHKTHQEKLVSVANESRLEGRNEVIKEYFDRRLNNSNLQIDENSRALLENCQSLPDVDELLEQIVTIARRSALHPLPIKEVRISSEAPVDPAQQAIDAQVGELFEHMN